MKKYIKPEIETTEVSACSMMCVSKHDEMGSGNQLSKEFLLDDEDEDEEW